MDLYSSDGVSADDAFFASQAEVMVDELPKNTAKQSVARTYPGCVTGAVVINLGEDGVGVGGLPETDKLPHDFMLRPRLRTSICKKLAKIKGFNILVDGHDRFRIVGWLYGRSWLHPAVPNRIDLFVKTQRNSPNISHCNCSKLKWRLSHFIQSFS